jgi:hypothetical protein
MEVNPANRREKIISLTETGKQYARELVLPLFQSEEEAAAQFTEQEMTEAIRMQEKFADALAKSMEEKVSIVHNLSFSNSAVIISRSGQIVNYGYLFLHTLCQCVGKFFLHPDCFCHLLLRKLRRSFLLGLKQRKNQLSRILFSRFSQTDDFFPPVCRIDFHFDISCFRF